jgi:hypothetical protein
MNFKQHFFEAISPEAQKKLNNMLEIEDITDQDLFSDTVKQAWLIIRHFPNSTHEEQYYLTLEEDGTTYFLFDHEGDEAPGLYKTPFINAVKAWELKRSLKPNTKETFGDLIDEL